MRSVRAFCYDLGLSPLWLFGAWMWYGRLCANLHESPIMSLSCLFVTVLSLSAIMKIAAQLELVAKNAGKPNHTPLVENGDEVPFESLGTDSQSHYQRPPRQPIADRLHQARRQEGRRSNR